MKIDKKEYTSVAFLDIEGAFNNVYPEATVDALLKLGISAPIVKLISFLLTSRIVSSTIGEATVERQVSRGTPQGGIISPLLWVVVVNELLNSMSNSGIKVIAYADDVGVICQGKYPQTLCEIMDNALSILSEWAIICGLGVNPNKTELVLFTRKYKISKLIPPKLNNTNIIFSESAKYLGITFDKKLNWNLNTIERIKKANIALFACKTAIGKRWGFTPKTIHWIFTAVVRPIILYGVLVWWTSLTKLSTLKSFQKVQRSAMLCITGVLRTVPSEALSTILYLQPLISAIRLNASGEWSDHHIGHASITQGSRYL